MRRGVERLEDTPDPVEATEGDRRPFSFRTPLKSIGEYLAPEETEKTREDAHAEAEERREGASEEAEE